MFEIGQKVVTKCTDNAITGYVTQFPMTGKIALVSQCGRDGTPKRITWYIIAPDEETIQRRLEGGCTESAAKMKWSLPEDQLFLV